MKRLFALLLVLILVFPLISCASSLSDAPAEEEKKEESIQNSDKTEKDEPITYPGVFSVGFGREEMNPVTPVTLTLGGISTGVKEDLFATCIAVHDGEKTALFFHMDMKETPKVIFDACAAKIGEKFGISKDHIIMTSTHTHASPHTTRQDPGNIKWRMKLTNSVLTATEAALRDLCPAKIFTSTGDTTGFAFSRRLKLLDGSYKMNPKAEDNPVQYEVEADPELRVIRFEREGKKDVILANWQSHYGAGGSQITSDFVYHMRKGVEEEMNALFAYFNGASANLSLHHYLGKNTYATYVETGKALARVVQSAVMKEAAVESGKIKSRHMDMQGQVIQDSEERQSQAKEIVSASGTQQQTLIKQYGFESIHEANSTNTRATMEEITPIPLTVITFGDIAFAANPFELFDISGKEIRDGSPFQMTFNCSYSNGHLGYMPPDEIFPHGGYEVVKAFFVSGTADNAVAESVRMLNECKNEN